MPIDLEPIGFVVSSRREVRDDDWDAETATIELDADRFSEEALAGLDTFSHVEVLYHFDRVAPEKIEPYMVEFGPRGPVRQPEWASNLMRDYWEA
jgi:tRNA (Thr-GGU) A37 N-methylase